MEPGPCPCIYTELVRRGLRDSRDRRLFRSLALFRTVVSFSFDLYTVRRVIVTLSCCSNPSSRKPRFPAAVSFFFASSTPELRLSLKAGSSCSQIRGHSARPKMAVGSLGREIPTRVCRQPTKANNRARSPEPRSNALSSPTRRPESFFPRRSLQVKNDRENRPMSPRKTAGTCRSLGTWKTRAPT